MTFEKYPLVKEQDTHFRGCPQSVEKAMFRRKSEHGFNNCFKISKKCKE